ncbi:MAG: M15 family metallopeptidase [Nonlabens sp.]|nr:M15 family metallopeptidase [Nonlabens sp.]
MNKIVTIILILFVSLPQQDSDNLKKLTGQYANPKNALEQDAQAALEKMQKAALKDGIQIRLVSGYRSFNRQREIWNRKYDKYAAQGLKPDAIFDKIVEYSTVPGTSRHHWGTDMDLIDGAVKVSGDVLVPDKYHGKGPFCKFKDWMENHATTYGFELVYTMSEQRTGFKYEPWHYSYVPLSRKRYNDYLTQVDLLPFLRSQNIKGMDKISDARLKRYLEEHIKGVNPVLKNN